MARSCKIFVASRASECTNWIHFIPLGFPVAFEYVWIWRGLLHYVAPCGTPTPIHLEGPGGNPIFWRGDVFYNVDGASFLCFLCYNPPPLNPGFGFEGVDSWRNSRKTHAISFRRWWENVLKSRKLVMKIHVSTSDFGGFVEHPRSHIQGWNSWMPYKKLPPQQRLGECWWTRIKHRVAVGQLELQ